MEANKTFYCGVCCCDTQHRYVNEDESRKFYACIHCDNGNHTMKITHPVHEPKAPQQVRRGDKDRVGRHK